MPSKKKSRKKPKRRKKRSGKKYKSLLLLMFGLGTLLRLSAQPAETNETLCEPGCVTLQVALEALDENDAIWEAELTDQLRALATSLEGRIAGLEVERDGWRETAEEQIIRANRFRILNFVLAGSTGIAVVVAIILGVI